MCRAQAEVHDLLARQYSLRVAGRFMPHATIKGFFRSDASAKQLAAAIDGFVTNHQPFAVHNRGPLLFGSSAIVLDIQHDASGRPNQALQALHRDAINALLPLVHPDCEFTPIEWLGDRFFAHLTLAMADLNVEFAEEVLEFVQEAMKLGPDTFVATTVQLFAFRSAAWNGAWWQDFEWDLLRSWRLS